MMLNLVSALVIIVVKLGVLIKCGYVIFQSTNSKEKSSAFCPDVFLIDFITEIYTVNPTLCFSKNVVSMVIARIQR